MARMGFTTRWASFDATIGFKVRVIRVNGKQLYVAMALNNIAH